MKYMFGVPIVEAEGYIVVEIEAPNETKAQEMANEGKGDMRFDRVDIKKLGPPVPMGPTALKSMGKA